MTIKNSLLVLLFGLCVVSLSHTPTRADPAPSCDNKCRERQYFYYKRGVGNIEYHKYETATCEGCEGKGKLCLPDDKDANTGSTCTTKAGGENGNKYWKIMSKTRCDFTTEDWIQAEAAEPEDTKTFTKAALMYCPPSGGEPDPGPGGGN